MNTILVKTALFLSTIIFGHLLTRFKIVGYRGKHLVSFFLFTITLPSTIICSFSNFKLESSFFLLTLVGLLSDCLLIALAFFLTKKQGQQTKEFYVMNFAGYNIGCFSLPFAQILFGPIGVVCCCMFDISNSIVTTGGAYTLLRGMYPHGNSNEKLGIGGIIKNLFSSVPFDTYMVLLALIALNVPVPKLVVTVLSPFGAINGYVSMLLLGLTLNLTTDIAKLKIIKDILLSRVVLAVIFSGLCFFLLPFNLDIQKILLLCFLSPIPVLSSIFTDRLGGDGGLASLAVSFSIIVSVTVMVAFILLMF